MSTPSAPSAPPAELPVPKKTVEVLQMEEDPLLGSNRWPGWRLVAACAVSSLCVAQVAISSGYASTAIPDLNSHRNPFHMNPYQQSWFISLAFIAAFFGSILSGLVNEYFGRKMGLLVAAVPSTIGWAILTSSQSVTMFYVGRFFLGLVEAICYNTASVYITEIAPTRLRGMLVSLQDISLNAGFLLTYVAGAYLPWNWLAMASAAPSVALALLVLLLPESPRWLLLHGDVDGATESLATLYPKTNKLDLVVQEMYGAIKATASNALGWRSLLTCPLIRLLAMSQVLFIVREFSGVHVLRTYTVTIFETAGSSMDPNVATIVVGSVAVTSSVCCALVIDRVRRTVLLPVSLGGMALGWILLGLCFFLQKRDPVLVRDHLSFLPLASTIGTTFFFGLGLSILPHVILNEMFPSGARGTAHTISLLSCFLFAFVGAKCFVDVQYWLGDSAAFWMFAGICITGTLFVIFVVPETKDKPLEVVKG